MPANVESNERPDFDKPLQLIADYVMSYQPKSQEALTTARYCLMDTLGCAMLALRYPECTKLLGPVVPGTYVPQGVRVPGTQFQLDPIEAAFNIGAMLRWLDFNDTWLAAEWGHPSDNLGGILAVTDYLSRLRVTQGKMPLLMRDVLFAMIKAHEIQGILALENSFNRVGLDHVILVKVATTAVVTTLLGGNRQQVLNALSHAWLDGQSLRTYRHAPNAGSRKSWAAGDATARAVRLALFAMKGEMGYPSALSAKTWGFCDVSFQGNSLKFQREFSSYVMENILFKLSYPAEFHAQTAVECAVQLHAKLVGRFDAVNRIVLTTHESAIRIISKTGPLHNPADRDHCLQYMVAVALLHGDLRADNYEAQFAADPRIDSLRKKMEVQEHEGFTKDYHDPNKRSIANSITIYLTDGRKIGPVTVEYPIGHRRRRSEGIPVLVNKFQQNVLTRFPKGQANEIIALCEAEDALLSKPVHEFMDLWCI